MISNIATILTDKLIKNESVSKEDRELYIYAFFMLFSELFYLVLTFFWGMFYGILTESIIYIVVFRFIRRYAGGYHASSETKCEIFSALSIFFSIGIIKLAMQCDIQLVLFLTSIVATITICFLCPLDTPEKLLTDVEYKHFKKISIIVLCIVFTLIIISYYFKINVIFAPCCISLILEAILLIAGKIKRLKTEHSE